jgi:hypothetical protein
MPFRLIDDGTLDTVVECCRCRDWLRFNPEPTDNDNDRIGQALDDAESDHECWRSDENFETNYRLNH